MKIFGIGLNKTGTTTLRECGRILGYRCTGVDKGLLKDVVLRRDFSRIRAVTGDFDLFQDWPWPLIYRELDEMCPGSKFILTVRRSEQAWLDSMKKHAMRTRPTNLSRKLAYGHNYPQGHESEYLARYRRHNDDVRAYFAGRDADFIELCWENGDGFETLCRFLDRPLPAEPFPHANKGETVPAGRARLLANRLLSVVSR